MKNIPNYHKYEWLRSEYNSGRTVKNIADEFGVSKGVISYWMKKANIIGRHKVGQIINNEKLCVDCKLNLSIDNFWKKKSSKNGYCQSCKNCISERRKNTSKIYRTKPHVIISAAKRAAKHRSTVSGRINNAMRASISRSLKNKKEGYSWENLVDYTSEELINHLENQFESWMNWSNWGRADAKQRKWQIDHIKSISSFIITSRTCDDFKECWALNNLRPLCAIENIRKGGG